MKITNIKNYLMDDIDFTKLEVTYFLFIYLFFRI